MPDGVGWGAHAAISVLAGVPPVVLTAPLDVLRTRRQSSRRTHLSSCARTLLAREGARGLQLGVWLTACGYTVSPAVKMMTYTALSTAGIDNATVRGAACGLVTASLTAPIWVVKVRTQLQPHLTAQGVIRDTLAREGWRGLYAGVAASCINKATEFCVFFTVYEAVKAARGSRTQASGRGGAKGVDSLGVLSAAGSARLCASIVAYPISVVTTRMREPAAWTAGDARPRGVSGTARHVIAQRAMFAGLLPHLCRTVPFSSLYFLGYESMMAAWRERQAQAGAPQVLAAI